MGKQVEGRLELAMVSWSRVQQSNARRQWSNLPMELGSLENVHCLS